MKQRVAAFFVLVLTAVLIFLVLQMSTRDQVDEIIEVNQYSLQKGRIIFLAGIEAPADAEYARSKLDKASLLEEIKRKITDQDLTLDFDTSFEPDSSSESLHTFLVTDDGIDVGSWLLEKGYARLNKTHQHKSVDHYKMLEDEARKSGVGIWNRTVEDEVQKMD